MANTSKILTAECSSCDKAFNYANNYGRPEDFGDTTEMCRDCARVLCPSCMRSHDCMKNQFDDACDKED